MKSSVKGRKTQSNNIASGDNGRVMLLSGMNPAERRQGDSAVAARGPHGGEKRR